MTSFLIKRFVKDFDKTNDKAVRTRYATLSCVTGIICNILLFTAKFAIGMLSSSMAVTADAFNNLSDMGSSLVVLLGFKLASKPADNEHPFGHGRMEYMSGFIVAVLIILVGVELLKSSIKKIFTPEDIAVSMAVIIGLVLSILLKLWLYFFNRKMGKAIDSKALKATATDSVNDCISTTAVLIAVCISAFTGVNIDAFVGVIVAGIILFAGFKTAKDTMNPLLGMPPSGEFVEELRDRLMQYEDFVGLHDLIVHNYGPGRIFASVHIEVPENIDIVKCHETIDRCEKEVGEAMNMLLVVHMDPIATDNDEVNSLKNELSDRIKAIDERLSLHDFRMVKGEMQTNLIFDVVLPRDTRLKTYQLSKQISDTARSIDPTYNCVITYDINLA